MKVYSSLKPHMYSWPTFTLGVKANVQPKSNIPIGAKVEISPSGFTLGVKANREKKLFNLPQVTNKC